MLFTAVYTTFTPLSRSRFRCNQTGVILKRARVEAYSNSRANNGRVRPTFERWHPPAKTAPTPAELRTSYGFYWFGGTEFACPHCWEDNTKKGRFTGETPCKFCRKPMQVVL